MIPDIKATFSKLLTDGVNPSEQHSGQLVAIPDQKLSQAAEPPTPAQVGPVAVTGQKDTIAEVMSTQMAPGGVAAAGSSTDSKAAYKQAHNAATKINTFVPEKDRARLLYEEQMARAIMEEYKTWLDDKRTRDVLRSMLREIDEQQNIPYSATREIMDEDL